VKSGKADYDMLDRVAASATPIIAYNLAISQYEAEPYVESPIEMMMLLALEVAAILYWRTGETIAMLKSKDDRGYTDYSYYIIPQYPMKIAGKSCRVDFMIIDAGSREPLIAIECDGHDFHERTRDQAKRDRSRDRQIQAGGIPVYRFTGSEIYANAVGCAIEVLKNLDERG
jgi:hypothetical protein